MPFVFARLNKQIANCLLTPTPQKPMYSSAPTTMAPCHTKTKIAGMCSSLYFQLWTDMVFRQRICARVRRGTTVTKPPFFPNFSGHFEPNFVFLCHHVTFTTWRSGSCQALPASQVRLIWSRVRLLQIAFHPLTMSFSFAPYKKHALVPGTPFKPCRSLELLSWPCASYSHSVSSPLSHSWAPVGDTLLVLTTRPTLWSPYRSLSCHSLCTLYSILVSHVLLMMYD